MIDYLRRMHVYLSEMFPLTVHLSTAALTYLATAAYARFLHGVDATVWTVWLPIGIWSYLAVPLMLRLMDELKDADIDRELFADRPLPSGKVRESDINLSLALVILLYLGANSMSAQTLFAALAVTGYALLMFKRFFAEQAHRRSLPLTLATHNPIVPLSLCYGFVLFAAEQYIPLRALDWLSIFLFVVMLWMPFLGWEVSRKIRAPEEEDTYVTYSQLLGRGGAVAFMCAVQLAGIAAAVTICFVNDAPYWLPVLPGLAWLASLWVGIRFVRQPVADHARLRPYAEVLVVATVVAPLIAFGGQLV
jgi:4-hydroxybenzoate polyprenyltransferase